MKLKKKFAREFFQSLGGLIEVFETRAFFGAVGLCVNLLWQ